MSVIHGLNELMILVSLFQFQYVFELCFLNMSIDIFRIKKIERRQQSVFQDQRNTFLHHEHFVFKHFFQVKTPWKWKSSIVKVPLTYKGKNYLTI